MHQGMLQFVCMPALEFVTHAGQFHGARLCSLVLSALDGHREPPFGLPLSLSDRSVKCLPLVLSFRAKEIGGRGNWDPDHLGQLRLLT